jgi:hypothetical protein
LRDKIPIRKQTSIVQVQSHKASLKIGLFQLRNLLNHTLSIGSISKFGQDSDCANYTYRNAYGRFRAFRWKCNRTIWPAVQKKAQGLWPWAWVWRLAIPYFRTASCRTIIGARRFHFRVRDGSGWFTPAMVTKQFGVPGRGKGRRRAAPLVPPVASSPPAKAHLADECLGRAGDARRAHMETCTFLSSRLLRHAPGKPIGRYRVKPHGQLVRVSCTHCWASTPRLSTS